MAYQQANKSNAMEQQAHMKRMSSSSWWDLPIDFPQGGSLVPQSNAQNQQIGINQVIDLISKKIEEISDNTYSELLDGTDGTHAAADKELKTDIANAFTGMSFAFSGELCDSFDNDNIDISAAVEILSIDKELAAPSTEATTTTSTGSIAVNTNATTSGVTVTGSGGVTSKPNETSTNVGVQSSYNSSTTNTTGGTATAGQTTSMKPGQYLVTYRVKISILYDRDSLFFSFSTGSTYSDYTATAQGLLHSPTKLTVTK